jgi:hypothetical protein
VDISAASVSVFKVGIGFQFFCRFLKVGSVFGVGFSNTAVTVFGFSPSSCTFA